MRDFFKTLIEFESLVSNVVKYIPDGPTLGWSRDEILVNEYVPLKDILPNTVYSSFNEPHISSGTMVVDEVTERSESGLKTKVSFATMGCLCKNFNCTDFVAADLLGVADVHPTTLKTAKRGFSPLIPLGVGNMTLPCPTHFQLDASQLETTGCDLVNTDESSDVSLQVDCTNNHTIEDFVLKNKTTGKAVARSLSGDELFPDNANISFLGEGRTKTSLKTLIKKIAVDMPDGFQFPGTKVNVAPHLEEVVEFAAVSILESFLKYEVPDEFSAGSDPSDMTLEEVMRILFKISLYRTTNSFRLPSVNDKVTQLLSTSSLYADIVASYPPGVEESVAITSIVMLNLLAGLFGFAAGALLTTYWKKIRDEKDVDGKAPKWPEKVAGVVGTAVSFSGQILAIVSLWKSDKEQKDYRRMFQRVEILGGGRFGGLAFNRVGRDYNANLVNIYSVEVTDASSSNILNILRVGCFFVFLVLPLAFWFGFRMESEDRTCSLKLARRRVQKGPDDYLERTPDDNLERTWMRKEVRTIKGPDDPLRYTGFKPSFTDLKVDLDEDAKTSSQRVTTANRSSPIVKDGGETAIQV